MKKLLSILLAALMLLSSVTVVMAEETTEYELLKGANVDNYALVHTQGLPAVDGLVQYTGGDLSGVYEAYRNNAAIGNVGYASLALRKTNADNSSKYDPVTFAEVIDGDNLYGYELQIEMTRPTTNIIADMEIGIGNYEADPARANLFTQRPSVAKTVYLGNVLSGTKAKTYITVKVDIADILDNGNEQKFCDVLDTYAELGRTINISEISIPSKFNGQKDECLQSALAEQLYKVCFSHESVSGITWWNMTDDGILTTKRVAENENMPSTGLVDENYNPKIAYKTLDRLINKEWTTNIELSSPAGNVKFNGFYGKYKLKIRYNGKTIEKSIKLTKNSSRIMSINIDE